MSINYLNRIFLIYLVITSAPVLRAGVAQANLASAFLCLASLENQLNAFLISEYILTLSEER
jgi:hypothetical protein